MTRYRRDRNPSPGPLEYAAACQRAMHEAIGERSRAFLAAADAGWSMRAIGEAVGLTPSMVHRIVVAEEVARENGYIHVPPPVKRIGSLPRRAEGSAPGSSSGSTGR